MTKIFGLIGYPLGHSFSKKYFTQKFADENISDCEYQLFPIESIDKLPETLQANPDLAGLNVTIPYKEQVLKYLTKSELPEGLNACNCIAINEGQLIGYNTDMVGFINSFKQHLRPHHTKALVLGAGGAAKAVFSALNHLNIPYQLVGRRQTEPNQILFEDITPELLQEYTVVINCTPLGTFPNIEEAPALPYDAITSRHYFFDLVYNPEVTKFLRLAKDKGATIQNGYDMLVGQAEEAWRIWNA